MKLKETIADGLNELIAGTLEKIAERIREYREGDNALADAQILVIAARIVRENRRVREMGDSK